MNKQILTFLVSHNKLFQVSLHTIKLAKIDWWVYDSY